MSDDSRGSGPGRALGVTAAILVALTLGLAFAHAMEWPVKMRYDAVTYTAINRSLYRYYAVVGGPLEVAAVLATAVLAFRSRGRPGFRSYLAGTIGTAAAFAVWLGVVQPANAAYGWAVAAIPADWERWRTQWETAHAARAVLLLLALVLILAGLTRSPRGGDSIS
ncbi:hypothetical protein [Spongiactinospora sp. 9N601]|uniref:hypothetical protein n=1 Tax=Spongiactinospora sp. 9N601 TaxID=3375149 RepID=UPI0037A714F7